MPTPAENEAKRRAEEAKRNETRPREETRAEATRREEAARQSDARVPNPAQPHPADPRLNDPRRREREASESFHRPLETQSDAAKKQPGPTPLPDPRNDPAVVNHDPALLDARKLPHAGERFAAGLDAEPVAETMADQRRENEARRLAHKVDPNRYQDPKWPNAANRFTDAVLLLRGDYQAQRSMAGSRGGSEELKRQYDVRAAACDEVVKRLADVPRNPQATETVLAYARECETTPLVLSNAADQKARSELFDRIAESIAGL